MTGPASPTHRWDPGEFLKPLRPGTEYIEGDPYRLYWIRDGAVVCGPETVVRGADADSFVFWLGSFAKDGRHCYYMGGRLGGANPQAFHALNNAYFKDDRYVWCIGGRIKDADAPSFAACDDGIYDLDGLPIPHGYGKDRLRVFYYDFNGKACWVRKADPATFQSLNDGHFGRDQRTIFCGHASIAGADAASWRKLGGYYSKDGRRIYYFNRVIKDADLESFRVVPAKQGNTQLARDRYRFYWNDQAVDYDYWLKDAAADTEPALLPAPALRSKSPPEAASSAREASMPRPLEVFFADDSASVLFHDTQFAGLEQPLAIFLMLCTHRSIEAFEKSTGGRLGQKAILRALAALNEKTPSPVAEVDARSIRITPTGMAVHRQFGKAVDAMVGFLARLGAKP